MKLNNIQSVIINPSSPFHFDSTIFKPAHFPSTDMKWESGKRHQTCLWKGKKLGLVLENKGEVNNPKIQLSVFSSKKLTPEIIKSLISEIEWRFNFRLDLKSFYDEFKDDPILPPIIKKFYGMRPMHHGSLYEYLVISILLQNAPVKRSVSMMQVLFEHYGTVLEYDNQKLWSFWEPKILARISEEELRSLKVGYRAKSLIKISELFANNEINEFELREMNNENLEIELMKLYGVGPASAWIIMFEVFNRMDYLKHISPWEQKIYTKLFFNKDYEKELVPVKDMIDYFDQKWGKWKNLAVNYIWEDLWWKRRNDHISWLERLIRL